MTEGQRAWRWTDLLGVVGVLLLVVWVPSYVASDPLEREAASDFTFETPQPRDGDRFAFSYVVTLPDGARHEVGPVLEIVHRAVMADEVPVPAVFVQERTYDGMALSVGPVRFDAEPRVVREYYDAEGRPVWSSEEARVPVHPRSGHDPVLLDIDLARRPLPHTGLTEQAGRTVSHVSSPVESVRQSMMLELSAEFEDNVPDAVVSGQTGVFRDQVFFASDDGVRGFLEGISRGLSGVGWSECAGDFKIVHGLAVSLDAPEWTPCRPHAWHWYTRDAPILVGGQATFANREGADLKVEVVPSSFVRGTGEEFYVEPRVESWRDWHVRHAWDQARGEDPHPSDRPQVRVADVVDDPRPIVGDVTLGVLREWAREGLGEPFAGFADDAAVIAFDWQDQGSEEEPETPVPDLLKRPQMDQEHEPVLTERYRFTLTLADGSGAVGKARLNMSVGPHGMASAEEAVLVCLYDCKGLPEIDLDRSATDPFVLLEEAREEASPSYFYWAPYYNGSHMSSAGFGAQGPHLPSARLLFQHQWRADVVGMGTGGGLALWAEHDALDEWNGSRIGRFVTFDLGSGNENTRASWERESAAPPPAPVGRTHTMATDETVEVIGWVPVGVASGGAALIFAALFFRLLGAVKGGAHYPLVAALYAKLSKDVLLDQEKRQEIIASLEADPGLTATDIRKRLGYGFGTTVHHLETLHRNGLVTSMQHGRKRHYFAATTGPGQARLWHVVTRDPNAAVLIEALHAHPGATASELVEQVTLGRSAISRTATKLERMGLVEKRRQGNRMTLWPSERARPPAAPTAEAESS